MDHHSQQCLERPSMASVYNIFLEVYVSRFIMRIRLTCDECLSRLANHVYWSSYTVYQVTRSRNMAKLVRLVFIQLSMLT